MADINVLPNSFDDTTSTNFEAEALYVHNVLPKNANISGGVPSGDIVFEINTGKDTFLDLFKTYMTMQYTTADANPITRVLRKQPFLSCMFQRAECMVNGVKIASSNNYTQDGALSRRLQFGKQYNQSINGYFDTPSIANDAADTTPAGLYTSTDTLDSFWLRQSEGLMVPPNSNIKFTFTVDSDYLAKASMKTTAIAMVGGCTINQFNLHPCYYVNPAEVKPVYKLRFVGINSFLSNMVGETSKTIQYTVSPTIVKACYTHLDTAYKTIDDGARKFTTAYQFNTTAPITLSSLQFKCGNVVYPQTTYNFRFGYEEAYQDYINHSQQIAKDSGKEEYAMYRDLNVASNRDNWGPIFIAPIVKHRTDPTNTLEVSANYSAAATQVTILTSLEEHVIDISMSDNSIITNPKF